MTGPPLRFRVESVRHHPSTLSEWRNFLLGGSGMMALAKSSGNVGTGSGSVFSTGRPREGFSRLDADFLPFCHSEKRGSSVSDFIADRRPVSGDSGDCLDREIEQGANMIGNSLAGRLGVFGRE